MRQPELVISERAAGRLMRDLVEDLYSGQDHAGLIQQYICTAYLGERYIDDFGGSDEPTFEDWMAQHRRIMKVDKVMHDRIGLMMSHTMSRYLRRRIRAREAVLEARRRAYAARKAQS